MEKILKDPIGVKKKTNGVYPWSFNAPTKDMAHSGSLSAGNDYGIGYRTPVGKEKCGSYESGPIPMKAECFSPDKVFGSLEQMRRGDISAAEDQKG